MKNCDVFLLSLISDQFVSLEQMHNIRNTISYDTLAQLMKECNDLVKNNTHKLLFSLLVLWIAFAK